MSGVWLISLARQSALWLCPSMRPISARQTAGIVEEVDPAIAFAGDFQRAQTLEQIRVNHPGMKYVFNFKADGLDAVVDFGHGVSDETLDAAIARIKADDLLTVVYTSGSTGKPKGAMLSNRNYTHIVLNGYEILRGMLYEPTTVCCCSCRWRTASPATSSTCASAGCGVVGYIPDAKRSARRSPFSFKPDLPAGRAACVREGLQRRLAEGRCRHRRGISSPRRYQHFAEWSKDEQAGQRPFVHRPHAPCRSTWPTVGKSVRSALGPNLKWLACGGAPLNVDLAHFLQRHGRHHLLSRGMA